MVDYAGAIGAKVSALASGSNTAGTSGARFCRIAISVQPDRLFVDANNQPVLEYPLKPGSVFFQWADPVRAMGWFAEANRLLSDQARISALNASVNTKDITANNNQALSQFQYLSEVLNALSHGYNLLNVAWHNDPVARKLYRQFISGPPASFGTNTSSSVFNAAYDYNPNWYTKDQIYPYTYGKSVLQQSAIQNAHAKNGDYFIPSALLSLASMDSLPDTSPVSLSPRIYNAPIVTDLHNQVCPSTVVNSTDFPWRQRCKFTPGGFIEQPSNVDRIFNNRIDTIMPDGSKLPEAYDDWRGAYSGPLFGGGEFSVTAPLVQYLPWLSTWTHSLLSRSAGQIIQDARAYTAWQNIQTLKENASAISQIQGLGQTISEQQHAPDMGWELAAGSLATVGAIAGSTGTPVGAIVGLVAGASAAVIKVTNAIVTKGTHGIGRDDLGRYKPQLERGWLSGDPDSVDLGSGPPVLPSSELGDPPGKGSVWQNVPCDPNAFVNPNKPLSSSLWGWLLLGGALVLGVVVVTQD